MILAILRREPTNRKQGIIFLVLSSIWMIAMMPLLPRGYYVLSIVLFYGSCVHFIYRKKVVSTMIMTAVSITTVVVFSSLTIFLFSLVFKDISTNFLLGLVAQSINVFICLSLYWFLPLHVIHDFIVERNRIFTTLSLNMAVLGILVVLYYNLNLQGFMEYSLVFTGTSLMVIIINFMIIQNGLANEHQKVMLVQYEEYMSVIESLVDEVKEVQHDYDNHVQGMRMAVAMSQSKDISEQFEHYVDDLEEKTMFREIIKLENPMHMGVLISKMKKAKVLNLGFEMVRGSSILRTPLKNYEQVEMLGILLDNAIEGCESGGRVQIEIMENGISTRNTHRFIAKDELAQMFFPGYSTKNADRGRGLTKLKKIVTRYKGHIEVFNDPQENTNDVVFSVWF
jgi:hypothetical protein